MKEKIAKVKTHFREHRVKYAAGIAAGTAATGTYLFMRRAVNEWNEELLENELSTMDDLVPTDLVAVS